FFGGIHEIYFPYILMQPLLLLAVIGGGAAGVFTFQLLNAGLVGPASPGSIVALIAMAPKGGLLPVLIGVAVSTVVSFVIAAAIYKMGHAKSSLEESKQTMDVLKNKPVQNSNIELIIFACDAGMGSSAMGATTLQKKLNKAGIDIRVENHSIEEIPLDAKLVITHESLQARAQQRVPQAEIIAIQNFLSAPEYNQLVERFTK
ncbi:MAG: PTS mannitol transporter subunit IIBC, partial [Erysipelothrix sp.]